MKKIIQQYIALSRITKPTGFLLLWIPCLWAIPFNPINAQYFIEKSFFFLIGAISLRTCGCIINDIFDRNIDKQVERTKNRPIASGKITVPQAFVFLAICFIPGFLVFLSLNTTAKIISLLAAILAIIYPLTKRWTYFPQFFLGITFNMGIFIAGINSIPLKNIFLLYVASIFWTLAYDTIYAFQDIKDDIKTNIKSTAVFFKDHPKSIIILFYCLMFLFITLHNIYFEKNNMMPFYFNHAATISIFLYTLYLIYLWNPNDPKSCESFFKKNIVIGLGVV